MKNIAVFAVAVILSLATVASGADIPVFPAAGGQFTFGCQDTKAFRGETFDKNVDTFNMIFVQEDISGSAEIGTVEVDDVTGIATMSMSIGPSPSDVRVACFAEDRSGNRSARSLDSFLVDRTAPEAPTTLVP